MKHNYDQQLEFDEVNSGEDKNMLFPKTYIQPFERVLAELELNTFVDKKFDLASYDISSDELKPISPPPKHNEFLNRTAYWERIGPGKQHLSLQVKVEATQALNIKSKLHRARRLRYGPHDFHEYRGKFFPQLVRSILNITHVEVGATVLDPFSGSGTTLAEATSTGMKTIGTDMNPLSVLVSKAKTEIYQLGHRQLERLIKKLISNVNKYDGTQEDLKKVWSQTDIEYLERWFPRHTLNELAFVRRTCDKISNKDNVVIFHAWLSNIIRGVSWQKAEDLRVRKEIRKIPKNEAIRNFLSEVEKQTSRVLPYLEVLEQHEPSFHTAKVLLSDARSLTTSHPDLLGRVDSIITSPPYATALPYLDTDRLSLIVLGLLPRNQHRSQETDMIGTREVTERKRKDLWDTYLSRKNELPNSITTVIDLVAKHNHQDEVGFRRRNLPALLGKYFLDMADVLNESKAALRPKGYATYVVGNNSTNLSGQKTIIPTDEFLWELGEHIGLKQVRAINMELLTSRDIFKENRGSSETILIFQKD